MTEVTFSAKWGKSEDPHEVAQDAIFLKAGSACLGYVEPCDDGRYMACVGAGIAAPIVYLGPSIDKAKAAVEAEYK